MIVTVLIGVSAVVILDNAETSCSSAQITETGRCGDDMTYSLSDGILTISGSGRMYDYSQTNAPWSAYGSDITKIIIDDKIIYLGEWAFRDCTNLKILTIPITLNSVRSNTYPAFAGCTGIEKVNLTYGTNGYGFDYGACVEDRWYQNTPWYYSRDSLKEVNFADGIRGIGASAFRELNITSLVVPESVVALGNHTFYNCEKLTDLTYPVSLRPFCEEQYPAFQGCKAIEKVTLTRGNGVPFDYGGIMKYSDSCSQLAPWNINSDVKKTIVISGNVTRLGRYTFCQCNIEELSIPISIDYDCQDIFFDMNDNLEKVTITKGADGASRNSGAPYVAPWNVASRVDTVLIEEGVTRVGSGTFHYSHIENLVLPNSLVSFGDGHVFSRCTIKNLTIPITLNATWIDSKSESAFSQFTYVTEKITFTPGDSGIGFNYGANEGGNNWYKYTPWHCSKTLKEIVFKDGIKSIGSNAFRELNITSVVIPDSVKSLGNHAFYHCDQLTDLTVPVSLDCVYSDEYPAFDQCTAITTLRLTSGQSQTGCDYSEGCLPFWCIPPYKAKTIIFEEGVLHIGSHALDGYTFHDSDGSVLEPIADNLRGHTFSGVNGELHLVEVKGPDAGTDDSSAEVVESGNCGPDARYNYYSDGTLEVTGDGWTYNYGGTVRSPWFDYRTEITKIVIGDGITDLGAWTFVGCKNVTELTMPITLNTVGSDLSSAFAGCYRIEKIDFTCGTDGYGYDYSAYYGNDKWYQNTPWYESRSSLRELNFADGIKGIGSDAFRELNITSLVIPESVVVLGNHAFYDCTELTDLTIPISLNSYGNKNYPAFQGCTAVEKVTFTRGNGVPFNYMIWNWGYEARNAQLTPWNINSDVPKTIVISDNVDSLGGCMFDACNIKELTLPVSVDLYKSKAFNAPYGNLEKVTITKGARSGCDYSGKSPCCFPWYKASGIKTLEIEDGVTRIGDKTFSHCNIEDLLIPETVSSFGKLAFYECTIKNLTIPISTNAVGNDDAPSFHYVSGIEKVVFTPGTEKGFDYDACWGNNCYYDCAPWQQSCSTLKEIVFTDGIKNIGSNAFRELNITSVVIPDSVKSLGNHTFYQCHKLTDLTIPISLDCVCSDEYPAFEQCDAISTLRLTSGQSKTGCDYSEGRLPIWCNSSHKASTIVIDEEALQIGSHTLDGYTFYDSDGSVLEPIADNLRGHTFSGVDGELHLVDVKSSDADI